jgi:hypothetical protein
VGESRGLLELVVVFLGARRHPPVAQRRGGDADDRAAAAE